MKKKIAVLLSLVMIASVLVCGCGNENENAGLTADSTEIKATIVDGDGETVELSSKELLAIQRENSAKFNQQYKDTEATIDGTVKRVENVYKAFGSNSVAVYELYLEEGWRITLLEEEHPEVVDFSKGDKVEITSTIRGVWAGDVEMYRIGHMGSEWNDRTEIVVK